MFNFEKLETWQKAIAFADLVYETTRNFPADERFGLTNQMRRAAISVSSNIAEGSARNSKNDYARFPEIAAEEQGKMLSGLRRACWKVRNARAVRLSTIN
jgi:four helix bundle protein